jgi:hypothetical protein
MKARAGRSQAGLRVDANASGEIEGVPDQDGVAQGERGVRPGKITWRGALRLADIS